MQVVTTNLSFQESPLVSFDDDRSWLCRIKDMSWATAKEIKCKWDRQYNLLRVNVHELFPSLTSSHTYEVDEEEWKGSKKLVVMIHGLNSSPLAWSSYLKEKQPDTSYFVPFVYKKGYCKCKEAARPILEVVRRYADLYPKNRIILYGHSKGAPTAAYIQQKLNVGDVRLVSIAGPHCGSMLVNWINWLGLSSCFGFSPKMVEELTYQGDWAKRKLIKWQNQHGTYSKKTMEQIFIASKDDWRIFPNQTSFPNLPNSSYFVVNGESHVTILDAVKEAALSYI